MRDISKEVCINSLEFDGVDKMDYPDFADAYIGEARFLDGSILTNYQLDTLNENSEFVYDQLIKRIF
tara:strand:- start:147 stop:347 length:201 start_codon:yes stop_codon:yes gene_type:complete